jgi:hypothetical protein
VTRWSHDELLAELDRYEAECVAADLAASTVHTYVNYSRMFVRWRVGDFHTSGGRGPAPRTRTERVDIDELRGDLAAYKAYLEAAGREGSALTTYVLHPRQFTDWLVGEFTPGSRRRPAGPPGASTRPMPLATTAGSMPAVRVQLPSDDEVREKRQIYADAEPRDLAYRVARHLIEEARTPGTEFSAGDGVAVLLMSWNAAFFRFRPGPIRTLAADLDRLISAHADDLVAFAGRSIVTYRDAEEAAAVERLYGDFVALLWPVGTAKALHVLAPGFFPIWDSRIADRLGLRLSPPASSAASYRALMDFTFRFAERSRIVDPVKALDEWAYVRFTLGR